MTTALAIVPCPSHTFPNFTALIAAVASNGTASEKARTRTQKRSAGMHVESRIDCPPVVLARLPQGPRSRKRVNAQNVRLMARSCRPTAQSNPSRGRRCPSRRSPDDERAPPRVGDPHAGDDDRSLIEICGLPLSDDESVAHQAA